MARKNLFKPLFYLKKFFLLPVCLMMSVVFSTEVSFSKVPPELEPDYAMALLAFGDRHYSDALLILNELVKEKPDSIEFLELKALVYKAQKDSKNTLATYELLISQQEKKKAPIQKTAPYHFEIGANYFRDQEIKKALPHLRKSIEGGFNLSAAHFFLGIGEMKLKNWEASSIHLEEVTQSRATELIPGAHLYLGQVYFKMKNGPGGMAQFRRAKSSAQKILNNPKSSSKAKKAARRIVDAVENAMRPIDQAKWFGSLALSTAYDSNVLALPHSTSDASATGKSTVKESMQAGIGYMSSPLDWIQYVPSYRASFNYNFNRESRSGEYFSQTLSLFLNRNPLESFGYGLTSSVGATFQNNVDATTDEGTFRILSTTQSVGGYAKIQLRPQWVTGTEISFNPIKNHNDKDQSTESQKRSGSSWKLRAYIQNERGDRYLNPSFSLTATLLDTDGIDNASDTFDFSLSNASYLTDRLRLSSSLTFQYVDYPKKISARRIDKIITARLAGSYTLASKWTLLSDMSYTDNDSTEESSNSYSQFVFSAGVSYSFF